MENKMKELDLAQMEKVNGGDNNKIGKFDDSTLEWIGKLVKSVFDLF